MSVSAEQELNYRAVMERKLDIVRDDRFRESAPAQRISPSRGDNRAPQAALAK